MRPAPTIAPGSRTHRRQRGSWIRERQRSMQPPQLSLRRSDGSQQRARHLTVDLAGHHQRRASLLDPQPRQQIHCQAQLQQQNGLGRAEFVPFSEAAPRFPAVST